MGGIKVNDYIRTKKGYVENKFRFIIKSIVTHEQFKNIEYKGE